MLPDEDQVSSRIFACPQCPKIFATRSNLKRHMENPNIHNIPYVRSRDQKRWKGHSKKVVSKEETTESNNDRMRKWRAENREKNRQNDLRCRVYRLARQKFGENDSSEKQGFVREEIARRLGRRMMMERREANGWTPPIKMRNGIRMMSPVHFTTTTTNNNNAHTAPSTPLLSTTTTTNETNDATMLLSPLSDLNELPFFSVPQQKIELPSIDKFTRTNSWSSSPPGFSSTTSSPILPHLSPTLRNTKRRTSSSSISSASSVTSDKQHQIKKERRRSSSSSVLITAAHAALSSTSMNTSPVPSSPPSSMLLTPTTPTSTKFNLTEKQQQQQQQQQEQENEDDFCVLPSMHHFLPYAPSSAVVDIAQKQKQQQTSRCIPTIASKGGIKYVDSNKILDEFVGVVLNYVDNAATTTTTTTAAQ